MNESPVLSRRFRVPVTLLLAAAFIAALALPGTSSGTPQRRPQFRAAVDVIQIQVVVEDDDNFVSGLQASDFVLEVNGRSRNITTVYEVDLGAEEPAGAGAPPPASWRQWILFFDAGFNSPRGVRTAREAAINFINDTANPRDLIGVASYTPVSGVRLLVPLTTDRQQVLDGVEGLGLQAAVFGVDAAGVIAQTMRDGLLGDSSAAGSDPGDVSGGGAAAAAGVDVDELVGEYIRQVQRLEIEQYATLAAQYTEQVGGTLADVLKTVRGRKQVVFFSKGFADQVLSGGSLDELASMADSMQQDAGAALANTGGSGRFGSADVREALEESTNSLRAADTVIHVVDTSGVGGERDSGLSSGGRGSSTFDQGGGSRGALTAIATATGGTMNWNTNDIDGVLSDLEASTRRYYVLAFPRERNDAGILELDVDVTRSGAEVTSAPAQLASPVHYADMSPLERQAQLAEYISKDIDESDLIVDVSASPFAGQDPISRLAVVIELPWDQLEALASEGDDDRIELEIFTYAINAEGTIVDLSNRPVGLDFKQLQGSPANGLPFRFYDLLWAVPGDHKVRVIIRDREVGRITSVTSPIVVPQHSNGPLAMIGPVPIDWEHPGMIMKGTTPDNAPQHKANGPLEFPFRVGDLELTPAAAAVLRPGGVQQVYLVVHNLARNPFNGQIQTPGLTIDFKDPNGNSLTLPRVGLIEESTDAASGGKQMLLGAEIPVGLQSGFYSLTITVTDQVAGAATSSTIPVWVSDG
jgi:VWFA-related protein